MLFKDLPIQKKLMGVIILISGIVLLVTCTAFFAYEVFTFRQTTTRQLSTLGEIIAANSTAALAFDDQNNANEILAALKAEQHITAASIYDQHGKLFSKYPATIPAAAFSSTPGKDGYRFEDSYLIGFQPVMQGDKRLGTLYLKSDMEAMYERLQLYSCITVLVIIVSFLLAYTLSRIFQKRISQPILVLAETAQAISERQDYSVRVTKVSNDELGSLTDAFNQMLVQIQKQNLEIVSFNQQLEQKVMERTNELEVSNKELESFTYSVSHDLRAPLRAVHSYSKILEEDYIEKLDDEGKQTIKVILRNSKKMGELIDDLLAFSRLGRKEVNSKDIHMDSLVRGVTNEFLSSTSENNNNVEMKIQTLPAASGDQALIKQVWVNLVSNAFKYSSKQEKIAIEIGSYPKGDQNVYYVKDNGVGFDMQYYDKLFGVFQRLHSQEDFEGTGVGLAITQRIVQKHHGEIWAESKLNEGTTFYFSLQAIQ
jgi:signal transduction histidine kinase